MKETPLQNVPIRTELARDIRRALLPRRDFVTIDVAYDAIEMRIVAAWMAEKEGQS